MSGTAMKWAWRQPKAYPEMSPGAHHLLLCIADRFNTKSGQAWPGRSDIAERTHLSESSIQRHTKELETLGLVQVLPRISSVGRKVGLLYRLPTFDYWGEREAETNSFDHNGKYDETLDEREGWSQ
jgi:hypothetical protein